MGIQKSYSIDDLIQSISGAVAVVQEYRGLPEDTLNLKLNPETWSCTEVCQHIVQFNQLYLKNIEKSIDAMESIPESEGPFKLRWWIRKLGGVLEPPYKIRIKTIAPMFPSNLDLSATESINRLIETEDRVLNILKRADEEKWNLNKISGRNPVFKFKMSLTEFIVYMDAHQRRHFWQIEQILKRLPAD